MKHKLSISIDEETIKQIHDKLRTGVFRNKSHLIEYSVKEFLKQEDSASLK